MHSKELKFCKKKMKKCGQYRKKRKMFILFHVFFFDFIYLFLLFVLKCVRRFFCFLLFPYYSPNFLSSYGLNRYSAQLILRELRRSMNISLKQFFSLSIICFFYIFLLHSTVRLLWDDNTVASENTRFFFGHFIYCYLIFYPKAIKIILMLLRFNSKY